MSHSTKVFMNGRSQAVRLPLDCRFDCEQVYIRKDPETDDVIISKRPSDWNGFFELLADASVPDDFMSDRDNDVEPDRDLF